MLRRYPQEEDVRYDPITDSVILLGEYRGASPVVGVRKLIMDSGAVELNDLQAFDEVNIGSGCIIKGNVGSGLKVTIDTSKGDPTVIIGDVSAIPIIEERKTVETSIIITGKGSTVIHGNLVAYNIRINGPAIIFGDVISEGDLIIDGPSLILGRVIGRNIWIKNATVFQVYAKGDVTLGPGVTLLSPIVLSKGGEIYYQSEKNSKVVFGNSDDSAKIRVFGPICLFCGKVNNPLLCERYISTDCNIYDYLGPYDYFTHGSDYKLITWYWRASPSMIIQNLIARRIHNLAKAIKPSNIDSTAKLIDGVALVDYPSKVTLRVIEDLRSVSGSYAEAVKKTLFKVTEEFFKARNIEYIKCPRCGSPLPKGTRICLFCGQIIGEEHGSNGTGN